MRRKMSPEEKRNSQIGIKVLTKTKKQLEYIAERDQITLSTLINTILLEYVENYFKIAKIDWDSLPEDEKEVKPNGSNGSN